MYTIEDFVTVYRNAVEATEALADQQELAGDLEARDYFYAHAAVIAEALEYISQTYDADLPVEGHLKFMLEIVSKEIEVSVEQLIAAYDVVFESYNASLIKQIKDAYAAQRMLLALRR